MQGRKNKKKFSTEKKVSEVNREQIVQELLPYIKYTALRLSWRLPIQLTTEDLINVGIVGLLESIERVDTEKGDVIHFVKHRIKGAMLDEINKFRCQTKSQRQKFEAILDAYNQLEREFGRIPEVDEVAERLGLNLDEYYELVQDAKFLNILSLDEASENHNGANCIYEIIADGSCLSPMERLEELDKKKLLEEIINELSEKEKLILSLYYWDELSMKEIAKVLDISEGRVCQIHKKVLIWLKAKLESDQRIKDFF
ncbi:MAG: FliA/WhiG family RNA polymerase sigma factor [Thermodesulfovibrionales bacterium]|nr:FliA/WhiG family RNA polymerase sigma factor [Thermodesulfovibrionales bacterium]